MGTLDLIIIVLVIAWLGGFTMKLFGSFIHIFLILALIVLALRLLGVHI